MVKALVFGTLCAVVFGFASHADAKSKAPVLKWDVVPEAVKYVVEISKSEDFKEIELTTEVKKTKYTWDSYTPGLSFWRVTGIDAKGVVGKASAPSELKVYLSKPKTQKSAITTEDPTAKIEWSGSKQAKNFELQIDKKDTFDSPQVVKTADKTFVINKVDDTSTYYWRARVVDDQGRSLSEYSDTFTVEFKTKKVAEVKPEEPAKTEARIYPYEAIGSFSALISSKPLLVLDAKMSAWLHSKPNDTIKLFGKERWGASAQFSKSIINGTSSTGVVLDLTKIHADIKYKIKPGVWGEKPAYGASLSFQSMSIYSTPSNHFGLGFFIGTNEILFIDNLLNKVSFLRYPRWYEAEVKYYLLPLSAGTRLTFNLSAQAAVKFFIRPTKFVYFGMGYSSNSYATTANTVQVATLQSVLGFGIVF